MVGFVGYALYWGSRARQEGVYASRELKLLVLGMMMCSVMIVRGVCRTAELSGGFKGSLAVSSFVVSWLARYSDAV